MRRCHNCGLSIGDTATFCATCGASAPAAATCKLCHATVPDAGPGRSLRDLPRARRGVSSPKRPMPGPRVRRGRGPPTADVATVATVANAIYSAVADEATCPECAAMDGRETPDVGTAAGWVPNPRCSASGRLPLRGLLRARVAGRRRGDRLCRLRRPARGWRSRRPRSPLSTTSSSTGARRSTAGSRTRPSGSAGRAPARRPSHTRRPRSTNRRSSSCSPAARPRSTSARCAVTCRWPSTV